MRELLEVARQGYFAWEERAPSAPAVDDEKLTALIVEIHKEKGAGMELTVVRRERTRRVHQAGPQRVRRLARAAGPACVHPRPYKVTTVQDAANRSGLVDLVDRDFGPEAGNQLWHGTLLIFSR
jgi:putative transposase